MNTTLIEATVYDNITEENGRAEVLNAIRELKAENERLREALKLCADLVDQELDNQGDDHSVGICMCEYVYALEKAVEALDDEWLTCSSCGSAVRWSNRTKHKCEVKLAAQPTPTSALNACVSSTVRCSKSK